MTLPSDPPGSSGKSPGRTSRPRRGLLIGGVTALLLVAVWVGSTVYAAGQAEATTTRAATTLDNMLRSNHLGSVERHTFVRGLTESTDDMYIVLGKRTDAYRLHLRNRIQHGPLPGLRQVGQAAVDTEIIWDAPIQAALDKAFGGRKPVVHTLIGLNGGTDTTIQIPAGQYTEGSNTASWQALAGQFQTSSAGRGVSGGLTWPGATIGSGQDTAELKNIRYTVDQQPYLKSLSQGKSSLSVASLKLPANMGQLDDLTLATTTAANSQNLESHTQLSAASVSAAGTTYRDLKFKLSATSLNSAALEELAEMMQKPEYQQALSSVSAQGSTQQSIATLQKLLNDLIPPLQKLLAGNPLLSVDEVSVQMPQGQLKVALGAAIVDGGSIDLKTLLGQGNLAAGTSSPALFSLLGNLKLSADIAGNQAAIAGLLNSSGDKTATGIAQSIDPMVQQGMITRKGDLLSTHLEFGKGGASINGKPVPLQ